ncbi:MAG: TorF family putative porin [Gallionella sp.]
MKRNLLNAVVLGALAMPTFAMAADAVAEHTVTSNVALVSNYLYRGISQTGAVPAIQGGFDYAHASGLYAGVWSSSISWLTDSPAVTGATSAQVELDTYFGYKGAVSDVAYDVGFLRYNYPATYVATLPTPVPGAPSAKADTNEIYGAATYSIVTAKVSYALGDLFGVSKAKGSTYFELNAAYPVADTGVTVSGHYGVQTYKGASADALKAAASDPTYSDYKLSVAKDFSGYALGLAYGGTNANKVQYTSGTNKYLGKSTAVLSLSRSF